MKSERTTDNGQQTTDYRPKQRAKAIVFFRLRLSFAKKNLLPPSGIVFNFFNSFNSFNFFNF